MPKEKITKKEYTGLLEEHFDLTSSFKKIYTDPRIEEIERTINDHREKFSVKYPKAVLISVLVYSLLTSLAMGVIIIVVTNEILGFPVAYSAKNIIVISSIFVLSKVKLKYFENS